MAKSAVAPKPAVVPDQPTELGVDSEWKCSLTPRVLRAHREMTPLARRRFLKLLSYFAPNIRSAGSHEERDMIMDRLAIAAVTFKKKTPCLAVSGRSGKRRKRVESKGRRNCRSWAAAQIAFGTLDLPSSSARWKVREAYLKFVEDHGIRPGHEALMSLTGLSAKCILGVLPAIEEDLGFTSSSELHELSQVLSSGVFEEVLARDLVESVQEILAKKKVHDQILWMLRFVLGYGPECILELVAQLRAAPSVEAAVSTLEELVAEWPSLTEACRESELREEFLKLNTSEQVRCRLCRLNQHVRDRLKALGYRA